MDESGERVADFYRAMHREALSPLATEVEAAQKAAEEADELERAAAQAQSRAAAAAEKARAAAALLAGLNDIAEHALAEVGLEASALLADCRQEEAELLGRLSALDDSEGDLPIERAAGVQAVAEGPVRPSEPPSARNEQLLLEIIDTEPDRVWTNAELGEKSGFGGSTVRSGLGRLAAKGYILRPGPGQSMANRRTE